jgi:hypothetical protein
MEEPYVVEKIGYKEREEKKMNRNWALVVIEVSSTKLNKKVICLCAPFLGRRNKHEAQGPFKSNRV